jgi:nucleoside-diphosphate kinase
MFIKRIACPGLTIRELFVGSIINVFSRQLKLVEYGDMFTRRCFEASSEKTFAMIKPDCYTQTGKIIDAIYQNGFKISKLKMSRFSRPQLTDDFYGEHRGKAFFSDLTNFMQSDVVTGMEIVNENAVQKFRDVIGPTNSNEAKQHAPHTLRARFGADGLRNAIHGSSSQSEFNREASLFFSKQFQPTAVFNNCTCAVIKPHIIQEGLAGQVIDMILQEGFEISSMQMFTLDRPTAEEFFEVYKGVLPEFTGMIEHMTSGPCIVLEIR